jgi:hypothetical protein
MNARELIEILHGYDGEMRVLTVDGKVNLKNIGVVGTIITREGETVLGLFLVSES